MGRRAGARMTATTGLSFTLLMDSSQYQQALNAAGADTTAFADAARTQAQRTSTALEQIGQSAQTTAGRSAAAYRQAADGIAAGAGAASRSMAGMGHAGEVSAGQTAQAFRQLPAQLQDVAVSLQGGMSPLTVLMQQGSQIVGSFGGVRATIAALGPQILAGLANPAVLAAAAVAGLGAAFFAGQAESQAFQRSIATTGNASGVTAGQVDTLSRALASSGAVTIGVARDITAALVDSGRLSGPALASTAAAATSLARVTGQSAADVVKQFDGMTAGVAAWASKANERYNFVTPAIYAQIRALEAQGRTNDAVKLVTDQLAQVMDSRMAPSLGLIERMLKSGSQTWSEWWDAAKGIGRADTAEQRLAALKSEIKDVDDLRARMLGRDKPVPALTTQNRTDQTAALQTQIRAQEQAVAFGQAAAAADAENAKRTQQAIEDAGSSHQQALAGISKAGSDRLLANNSLQLASASLLYDEAYARQEISAQQHDAAMQAIELARIGAQAAALQRQRQIAASVKPGTRDEQLGIDEQLGLTDAQMVALQERRVALAAKTAQAQGKDLRDYQSLVESLTGAGTGLEASFGQQLQALHRGYEASDQSAASLDRYRAAVEALIAKQPFATKAAKEQADAQTALGEAFAGGYERMRSAAIASADSVDARVRALADDAAAAQISQAQNIALAAAVELVAIKRLEEAKAQAVALGNNGAVEAINREIEARQRLADQINTNDQKAKAKQFADDLKSQFTSAFEQSMQAGNNAFKSFWQALSDTVRKTTLKVLVEPAIKGGLTSLAASIGIPGTASAGTGAGTSSGGGGLGLGSLSELSAITKLSSAAETMAVFGKSAFTSALSGSYSIGQGMTSASQLWEAGLTKQAIGQGAGTLAAAAAGFQGGRLAGQAIGNGYSIGGGTGNGVINAGAAIGMALGGPLGALAGGALGGVANRTFGRKQDESGIVATLGGAKGVQGQTYTHYKGGLLRSDKTDYGALSGDLQTALETAVKATQDTTTKYAETLGLSADAVAGYTKDIKVNLQGMGAADAQAAIGNVLAGFADDLAGTLGADLSDLAVSGETSGATLARLAGSLDSVNSVLTTFGDALLASSLAGADAASKLIEQMGGAAAFADKTSAYYDTYYTKAEHVADTTRTLTEALAKMGMTLPATRAQWREMVSAQDLTTESGRSTYAALISLSGAFATISESSDDAAAAIESASSSLVSEIDRLRGKQRTQTASGAAASFAVATAQARAGSAQALADLPALSQAVETAAEAQAASALDLARTRAWLEDSLASTVSAIGGTVPTLADTVAAAVASAVPTTGADAAPQTAAQVVTGTAGVDGLSSVAQSMLSATASLADAAAALGGIGSSLESIAATATISSPPSQPPVISASVIPVGTQMPLQQAASTAGVDALIAEIQALRAEVRALQDQQRAQQSDQQIQAATIARNTGKTAQLLDRVMPAGDALSVRVTA